MVFVPVGPRSTGEARSVDVVPPVAGTQRVCLSKRHHADRLMFNPPAGVVEQIGIGGIGIWTPRMEYTQATGHSCLVLEYLQAAPKNESKVCGDPCVDPIEQGYLNECSSFLLPSQARTK